MIVCLFHFLERRRKGKCRALKSEKKKKTSQMLYSEVCRYHLTGELLRSLVRDHLLWTQESNIH